MDKSLSNVDNLKLRILSIKPLPNDHTDRFMEKFPEYNNKKGIDKYRNVTSAKSADQDITEKLEKLFKKQRKVKKAKKAKV